MNQRIRTGRSKCPNFANVWAAPRGRRRIRLLPALWRRQLRRNERERRPEVEAGAAEAAGAVDEGVLAHRAGRAVLASRQALAVDAEPLVPAAQVRRTGRPKFAAAAPAAEAVDFRMPN